MQKNRKQILIRYTVYFIELILVYALERIVNSRIGFSDVYIFMMIPTFVSIVLFERENSGMVFGILAGMLIDYGHGHAVGGVAIFLCIFGYGIGLVSNYILCANVFIGAVVSTFLVIAVEGMKVFCLMNNMALWHDFLINCFWKDILIAISVFVIMFYINRVISYKFGGKEEIVD